MYNCIFQPNGSAAPTTGNKKFSSSRKRKGADDSEVCKGYYKIFITGKFIFVNQEKTNQLYVNKYTHTYSSPTDPKNDSKIWPYVPFFSIVYNLIPLSVCPVPTLLMHLLIVLAIFNYPSRDKDICMLCVLISLPDILNVIL